MSLSQRMKTFTFSTKLTKALTRFMRPVNIHVTFFTIIATRQTFDPLSFTVQEWERSTFCGIQGNINKAWHTVWALKIYDSRPLLFHFLFSSLISRTKPSHSPRIKIITFSSVIQGTINKALRDAVRTLNLDDLVHPFSDFLHSSSRFTSHPPSLGPGGKRNKSLVPSKRH